MKKLGLVHTSATLVPVFAELCAEHLPSVRVFHISDESLIKDVIEAGELTAAVSRRVASQVLCAADAGADLVMVTCSSIGPAVERAAGLTDTPVLRVDQPMADEAIRAGGKVGVAATLPTTLRPTADLIRRRAAAVDAPVDLTTRLCEGAFDALMSGDPESHDEAVKSALEALTQECDVVVLAQASMARVAEQLDAAGSTAPILSSPRLAIRHLTTLL